MRESISAEPKLTPDIILQLTERSLSEGGFVDRQGGAYRTDATAWTLLTLMAAGLGANLFDAARSRLATDQLSDGGICISSLHAQAFWPTALTVMAWEGSIAHRESQARAVQFLLATTGRHWKKPANDIMGHNPAFKGWPWIAETHSWVEPTALSVIALSTVGYGKHPRIEEAVQMLMDRQLRAGGWNYGNTSVFGQELHSAPESTGAALHALTGRVARQDVQRSLDYLSKEVTRLHTPISLGWSLLALNSWGVSPPNALSLIARCFERQEQYGPYDTTSLCLLVLPLVSPNGLLAKSAGAI
jgi:hypothetical protein